MNNGTDANLPDQSLEHLTDASKLLVDPSAFEFLLESIYGDNRLNSKVAATLRTSFARECAKAKLEELGKWFTARSYEIAVSTPDGITYYPVAEEARRAIDKRREQLKEELNGN